MTPLLGCIDVLSLSHYTFVLTRIPNLSILLTSWLRYVVCLCISLEGSKWRVSTGGN